MPTDSDKGGNAGENSENTSSDRRGKRAKGLGWWISLRARRFHTLIPE